LSKSVANFVDGSAEIGLVSYAVVCEVGRRGKDISTATKFASAISKAHLEGRSVELIDIVSNYNEGIVSAYAWSLIAQDCAYYTNSNAEDTSIGVVPEFEKAVTEKLAIFRRDKKSDPKLSMTIAAFDKVSATFWNTAAN